MFNTGDTVKVLVPFSESFPDEYIITEKVTDAIGQVAYILGDNGGFDEIYLELV
jgi:hypothetical protein